MNSSIIRYILGQVLKLEGILMLLPCITALIYSENEGFSFLLVAILCYVIGFIMTLKKPSDNVFYLKEGCVTTALSWIFLSIFGCLPFVITKEIPSFVDALFETVSGFTTTGASILSDVEGLSHCSLLWRCFTHWIGGMGVLVFILAIVPLSGGSNINIMRAESPGPSVGKLVPKLKSSARILYAIYFFMTLLQFVLLLFGGMNAFDSFCLSVGTAGTGGFGVLNDSFMSYSPYIQWVTTIFMILFGVNFNAYYFIIFRQFKKAVLMEEVRYYFLIIFGATAVIFFNILDTASGIFDALTHASFQVASIITTTGFASTDFNTWCLTAKMVLVLLMFIGACAGSTGGGIKVSRIVILIKTVGKELNSYIHPKSIKKIKMEDKPLEHDVVRSVNVYFITYMLIFIPSLFLLSLEGQDSVSTFTSVTACLNNIGPGLGSVGPTGNFGHMTILSKLVLIIDMLAGRLELFPLLILFRPVIWKDMLKKKVSKINIEKN